MSERADDLFRALSRAILFAAGIWMLLWFAGQIRAVLLLFVFAMVLALSLNAPVSLLERRGLPRLAATVLVGVTSLALLAGLGWLIGPRFARELASVVSSLPGYAEDLANDVYRLLEPFPELQESVRLDEEAVSQITPWLLGVASDVWGYALTLVFLVVIAIVLVSLILYMLASPRPLLEGYLRALRPESRDRAQRAFTRASGMVVGWMGSNLIVGTIEAVLAFIFLSFLEVPGALVWSVLALFAELVPKLGPYLMAIPPVLVSLSVDPIDALWVALFYWIMSEVMGDLVMPRVRRSTMDLHPVYSLFITLALAAAFGLLGALVATPVAAFIKAYYDEFFLARRPPLDDADRRVDAILNRNLADD